MKFNSACVATWRKFGTWISLACIVAAFVLAVVRLHPTNFFGYTEDDSIYFSSAKGLAEGKGYVLASFPGTPAATKYPIFYPWLLSWVWRWNPLFPANLTDAIAISVAFGAIYIVAAYFFLRRFKGIGEIEALILTAFCALHPVFVFYSSSVLSDIPFAAFVLCAMLLAERSTLPSASNRMAFACGALVGLAILIRAFGVPVAVGIVIASALRRAWRPLMIFCAAVAPFFALLCWQTVFPHVAISPVSGAAASSLGWTHTWAYYTSYLNDWKQGVPNIAIFLAVLKNNFFLLLSAPASYFISPEMGGDSIATRAIALTLTTGAVAGILRKQIFRPVYSVLPFYVLLILLWNYGQAVRFLLPFLPLFAAGIWLEGKHAVRMVRTSLAARGRWPEKIVASALGVTILLLTLAVAQNYVGGVRAFCSKLSARRASLLEEKREAYRWLSRSTGSDARVVAYEDASLYLYTNRASTRPFTFATVEFFDPPQLERDIVHITDVSKAVGAEYWVSSEDDYDMEWSGAFRKAHAQMKKLEEVWPVGFASQNNRVRVYRLGCTGDLGCESARDTVDPQIQKQLTGAL